ncbi:ABC transporter permease [Sporomusa aerivorans]|uniref:ABC transporter permease n=1 Tax=Sporomusa aerivorans TaxID=204936 RepID=UPI00352B8B02
MNWWHIAKREFRDMFITDKRRALFLFGASLAYLFLFALLYGAHTINAVPLVIYDEDQTQFSRSLLQGFEDSERFQIIGYVTSEVDMEQILREKEAAAAIHIPKKFAQDAKSGRSATVLLIADGANILITNTVTNASQEIVATFAKETAAGLTEINSGQLPSLALNKVSPVDFRLRVLNNPTQSYLTFFVLGLAMAAFQQGVFLAVGASIQSEYQRPDELKNASPLTRMTGKLLPYWLAATVAFLVTISVAVHFFAIPGKASIISLVLLASAFILAATGFSAFVAAVCNNELTFTGISIAYTVPAFVLSGYTWPQAAMDTVLSYAFPLTYFADTVRELMLAGYSPALYLNCFVLLFMGIAFTGLATVCFSKRL